MNSAGDPNTLKNTTPRDLGPVQDPRVYLAAERTFLAWVRTSLALMGFGFLIARFAFLLREAGVAIPLPEQSHRPQISPWVGFSMICFGVVVCIVSGVRYRRYIQALEAGTVNPSLHSKTPLIMASVLALVGLVMAVHILAL